MVGRLGFWARTSTFLREMGRGAVIFDRESMNAMIEMEEEISAVSVLQKVSAKFVIDGVGCKP